MYSHQSELKRGAVPPKNMILRIKLITAVLTPSDPNRRGKMIERPKLFY